MSLQSGLKTSKRISKEAKVMR